MVYQLTQKKQIDMSKYKYSQEEAQNEFTYLVSRKWKCLVCKTFG